MLKLTLQSDSLPSLAAYVSSSPRPLSRRRQPFCLDSASSASYVMDRASSLFTTNRDIFIHLIVENETSSLINYSLVSSFTFSSALYPDSTEEFIFDSGANCTILDTSETVQGYLLLDFSTKVIFDEFSLLFSILDYEGDLNVTLSDRVAFMIRNNH